MTLKTIISRTLQAEKEVYIGFIDMEKAFDRVPRETMWDNIRRKSVRVQEREYARVATKNITSREFQTLHTVRQGGSLNTLLFTIDMDEIFCNNQSFVI